MHSVATKETTEGNVPETLPFSLPLELTVTDPEVISELFAKQEGRERDEYAPGALRLGVLALRQAPGADRREHSEARGRPPPRQCPVGAVRTPDEPRPHAGRDAEGLLRRGEEDQRWLSPGRLVHLQVT